MKTISVCTKHIVCLHGYHELSKFSPVALTHTVKWWRHCCIEHTSWQGLVSPIGKHSWISYMFCPQCQFSTSRQNPIYNNLFQANNCFCLRSLNLRNAPLNLWNYLFIIYYTDVDALNILWCYINLIIIINILSEFLLKAVRYYSMRSQFSCTMLHYKVVCLCMPGEVVSFSVHSSAAAIWQIWPIFVINIWRYCKNKHIGLLFVDPVHLNITASDNKMFNSLMWF